MSRFAKPSQRDIARLAQVSQTTVSMVITGKAEAIGISYDTQERIRQAMRELGYTPNVAARSLQGGRNGLIGVHTFEPVFPVSADDYFHQFLVGIEQMAVELGQDLVLFASTQGADGTRSIYRTGVNRLNLADGVIMLGIEKNDSEVARLRAEGYPFVLIGRRDVAGVPFVTTDYVEAAGAVVDQLVSRGHRSIGYLARPLDTSPQNERREGFRERMSARGAITVFERFVEPADLVSSWLRDAMASGTTAIVVENYELIAALDSAASDVGVAIPEHLSVVCLDWGAHDLNGAAWSHLSVPRRELGRRSVAVLMALLEGEIGPDHAEVVPCELPGSATIAAPRSGLGADSGSRLGPR
ncbi:LacI family DNA-binding transcriptional regulator [Jiangella endophytica]|uniref:LacI family DNA-binding transcriptional regulator n=1 Tax=Jiangella endophytica TaxID=1623398 RepID=UPI0018E50B99|nr:LacI family DNA-binding transcriptional regulator [Jiangella endophytica]